MESLLVGVDRSEASRRALRFALERARDHGAHVRVVHVINWSRYSFPTLEENERRPVARKAEIKHAKDEILTPLLDWAEEEGLLEGITMECKVRHGRPSEVLSEMAVKRGHDLIVVGRVGDSDLKTAIFGSTPSRLVQHAPVPVVVVP